MSPGRLDHVASSGSALADRLKHIILNSTARGARETPCCSEICADLLGRDPAAYFL